MAESLFFYKLVSPYYDEQGRPIDQTLNCKLQIGQIDSNFLTLKDYDISAATFIGDEKLLVLTRNNGDKIAIALSGVTYNLNVATGTSESGNSITISYDGNEVTLSNVLTYDNLGDILTKVVTDSTLKGSGTMASPLGLSSVERTNSYAPVIKLIDTTKGEKLPIVSKLGTRYITKEWVNDYGFLYNGNGVNQISDKLADDGRGWRIPSKADWDALLNSIEPCAYRNHNSAKCHAELGKVAGHYLKTECGWIGQEPCECNRTKPYTSCTDAFNSEYTDNGTTTSENLNEIPCSSSVDKYGMSILPAGAANPDSFGRPQTDGFREKAYFWSTTHIGDDQDQDVYVKEFVWNKCGVYQIAECPSPYYSIRLVKDFDGTNYRAIEEFDGITYDALLFPESKQIWLASNYASKQGIDSDNYTEVNAGDVLEKRIEFYINEWNGQYWERKRMSEGDTIIIENPDFDGGSGDTTTVCWYNEYEEEEECIEVFMPKVSQNNIEYRVYTEDDSCNKTLVNTDDLVVERVIHVIVPMLEQERMERIESDKVLSGMIETERDERIAADEILSGAVESISGEVIELREVVEAVSGEVIDLREGLDEEIERAKAREDEIEEELLEEIDRAKATENEISGLTINSSIEYIMTASASTENLILESKDGNPDHYIKIKFDGNFGEF